jgi:predicted enzyme related to lactoylglutathione lyase
MRIDALTERGRMTMESIEGLAGVLIWTAADRFPAMARFYRDTLGLVPRSDKADFINFDWTGVRLSVGIHGGVDGASRDPLRIMVNLTVADIGAVHDRLVRAGVVFTRAPAREEWGGWVATFADPDGNVLQLLQLP